MTEHFDAELASVEGAVRACAEAGVDAIIVQDLGVARLARAIAPNLPIHASTQMTCTDASSVELAREVGATRVILARELSLDDIAKVRRGTDVEVEVFVHGALCISYSGQCLTSEAIGGRSANRGACAQACRLPYELVVDGELVDTADRAYLLSPEDLETSALVPDLVKPRRVVAQDRRPPQGPRVRRRDDAALSQGDRCRVARDGAFGGGAARCAADVHARVGHRLFRGRRSSALVEGARAITAGSRSGSSAASSAAVALVIALSGALASSSLARTSRGAELPRAEVLSGRLPDECLVPGR